MKASVAHSAIASKCQVHEVGGALNLLWKFTVLETANQVRAAIRPIIYVQKVIVGFNAETAKKEAKKTGDKSYCFANFQPPESKLSHGFKMRVSIAVQNVSHAKRFVLCLDTKIYIYI